MNNHKVAIITGITGGIGRAIALTLAKNRINLVGVARNKERIVKVLEELKGKYPINYLAIPADVSESKQIENVLAKTMERFQTIDILINNAGVGVFDYIVDSRLEDWQRMIDVNLKGVYLCSKAVLPQMMKQRRGKIINISSVCGLRGYLRCGIYCASKFGVLGFTEVLAKEAKPYNIGVSAVCPDIVATGFANNINYTLTDEYNMLKPQDVADLVFSLSKLSSKSQICEIGLKPRNIFDRILRIKRRKVVIKTIKYL